MTPSLLSIFGGALVLLYLAISPRYAQWYYRRKIFEDPTAEPSRPHLVESFHWQQKVRLFIRAEDGTPMNAWFFRQENPLFLAVYSIGRRSNISNCLPEIDRLLAAGYSVLIAEYRGFGQTDGYPSIDSICTDGLSIFDYAVNNLRYHPGQIVVFGESLGGGVASFVAQHRQPAGLILKNAFRSLPVMGRETVPIVRIFPDFMYPPNHLDNEGIIQSWKAPLLVVHSYKDETIPFEHGWQLYQKSISPAKYFLGLNYSTHRDIAPQDEAAYLDGLRKFLQSLPVNGEACKSVTGYSRTKLQEDAFKELKTCSSTT